MADGDVIIDSEFEIDDPAGYRIELFVCEDTTRPGDMKYRFQCYDPDTGETMLRYDNSHDHSTAGWHHRHTREDDEPDGIAFTGLRDHIQQFRNEVQALDD